MNALGARSRDIPRWLLAAEALNMERDYECHSLPRVGDEGRGERMNLYYTDNAARAAELATTSELRPSWNFAWVTDRRPINGR
jgi:hypothetical protein